MLQQLLNVVQTLLRENERLQTVNNELNQKVHTRTGAIIIQELNGKYNHTYRIAEGNIGRLYLSNRRLDIESSNFDIASEIEIRSE
jgi:hypothetical protein